MVYRKATRKEIDRVMQILLDARTRIGRLGIDQWQYCYPTRDIVLDDFDRGRLFVAVDENETISAVFSVITDGEPTYDKIYDGAWLSGVAKYMAVHRFAVAPDVLRAGVGSAAMQFAISYAKENGFVGVRIDTHEGNVPMRGMLEKNGFVACGKIFLEDGQPRVAYERLI